MFVLNLPPGWLLVWVQRFEAMPLAFGLALLFFGRRRLGLGGSAPLPVSYGWAAVHLAALTLLLVFKRHLAHAGVHPGMYFRVMATVWTALLPIAVVSLATALIPLRTLLRLIRSLGIAWAYAALCTALLVVLRSVAYGAWEHPATSEISRRLQEASFGQTRTLLGWFYPLVLADPARQLLGTPRFLVQVSWLCSGIEGLALVGVLTILWLIFARRELRLNRAVLILPMALGLTWVLNLLRLALLIALGDAGHPKIAGEGFHAQAGWIASNFVSLGALFLVQRVAWFQRSPAAEIAAEAGERRRGQAVPMRNPAAVYLVPFAAIVAASLLSQAVSSGFEWLYPLRFAIGLAALWWFRREYRRLDWRFGWVGLVAGMGVAAMWLALHAVLPVRGNEATATATAAGLLQLPTAQRLGWILVRVLAAVTTVPLAEELAFRGFLARRVMQPDFERVRFADLSWLALGVSSLAFGALHGRMWAAGAVAGLVFGLAARWRGRLGEAVAAHLTANLAIAAVVVLRGDYTLW